MFETLTIPFAGAGPDDSGRGANWVRLEQEYKESVTDTANLGDLAAMLTLAKSGVSAFKHVADTCPYATVKGDIVTVKLDIYVWPSSMNLPYSLAVDLGAISAAAVIDEHRSFDVPFDGSDSADLPYVFAGTLTPEMPFIASDGSLIVPEPSKTVKSSRVTLSETATCVLRADGKVKGYKHTVEMKLVKAVPGQEATTGYKIENLRNTIVLSWLDENGETQTDTLTLAIPQCVKDLLGECPDGKTIWSIGCLGRDCGNKDPVYVLYYSTCYGAETKADILLERWETPK